MAKKIRTMGGLLVPHGNLRWLTCCFPTMNFKMPTASPLLLAATPDMIASSSDLKGLVVLVHGWTDGPLVLAHLCEQLASHGFVVVAPSFSDAPNNESVAMTEYARRFLVESTAVRTQLVHDCIAAMRATYPDLIDLPVALIGYSLGTDTVRHVLQLDCPRIYIGGPGWQSAITRPDRGPPVAAAKPAGPSLQLLGWPDDLMQKFGFGPDEAAEATGYPTDERALLTPSQIALEQAAGASAGATQHARIVLEPYGHGDFKYAPFHHVETLGWKGALCGLDPFHPCGAVDYTVKAQRARYTANLVTSWLVDRMSYKMGGSK